VHISEADVDAVLDVLRAGQVTGGEPEARFEEALRGWTGSRAAIAVSSGTAGLLLAMRGAGLEEGDLVLTSPFSFVAAANAILYQRAWPVYVDVDPVTGNLDSSLAVTAIEDIVAGGKRARSWLPPAASSQPTRLRIVLPVHLFGRSADLAPIAYACRTHGIALIEDACEALGATYQGRSVGAWGAAGVFAFSSGKQVCIGEGGMIVTDDLDWAEQVRALRNQGRQVSDGELRQLLLGLNFHMDAMGAALGASQMRRLPTLIDDRARLVRRYAENLRDVPGLSLPLLEARPDRVAWFCFPLGVEPPPTRDHLLRYLADRGVPAKLYFRPIHLQPYHRHSCGYRAGQFPIAERLGDVSLALPLVSAMGLDDVDRICEEIYRFTTSSSFSS